jgi:hypothetical protein
MMQLPSLNLIERLALWILVRSHRTSLVVVKELHWPEVFVAADQRDEVACYVTSGQQDEPASHLLERLYHSPAYGEFE